MGGNVTKHSEHHVYAWGTGCDGLTTRSGWMCLSITDRTNSVSWVRESRNQRLCVAMGGQREGLRNSNSGGHR